MSGSACVIQPPSPSAHFVQERTWTDMDLDTSASGGDGQADPVSNSHKSTTTIIFDWDDTLLPSSWLSVKGLRLDYPASSPGRHRRIGDAPGVGVPC